MHPNTKWVDTIALFDELIVKYQLYRTRNKDALSPDQVQFAAELEKRLWQMRWALEQIGEAQLRANAGHFASFMSILQDPASHDQIFEEAMHFTSVLEFLTEGFYFVAWRCLLTARLLPGLKNVEVEGIRDVRNRIIEHPERSGGIVDQQFSVGRVDEGEGPRLKGAIPGGTEALDRGLLANACEFFEKLAPRLDAN